MRQGLQVGAVLMEMQRAAGSVVVVAVVIVVMVMVAVIVRPDRVVMRAGGIGVAVVVRMHAGAADQDQADGDDRRASPDHPTQPPRHGASLIATSARQCRARPTPAIAGRRVRSGGPAGGDVR